MRLPFPLPEATHNPVRAAEIVAEVGRIMTRAIRDAEENTLGRAATERAQAQAEALVEEYFDIKAIERMLIGDTDAVIIPSVRPTRRRAAVPTIMPATRAEQAGYTGVLCDTHSASGRAAGTWYTGSP